MLVIAKQIEKFQLGRLAKTEKQTERYTNRDGDPRGPWKASDVLRNEARDYAIFPVTLPSGREVLPPPGTSWRYTKEKFAELISDNRIWFGVNGDARPAYKRFLTEVTDTIPSTTIWPYGEVGHNDEAKKEMRGIFGEDLFGTPKPERLLQRVIQLASSPGDWVLDSFGGSGTTGAVAHKMGRRWIMVELGEHCHTHIIPRMRKVVDGTDQGGISQAVGWKGGGGFKYYRLAESLLVRDKDLSTKDHPVYVINPRYDGKMLIRAICKIENFRFRNDGRLHGISSENRFLHVTTSLLTQGYLDSLAEDIGPDQSLLVYCTRRVRDLPLPENVEIKRIPRDLLGKCDFEEGK